jgi:electron transfer flavoprotein alpha subunit
MSTSCNSVLVVAETADGRAGDLSFELLGIARQLVQGSDGIVSAAVLERPDAACIRDLGARGADRVFSITDDRSSAYGAERWLATLPSLLAEHGPSHILLGHTALGAELGPRLAFRLGTTVATGCERLELKQGKLSVLRPCFGNKARETLRLEKCPAVATVRARMSDPLPPTARDTKVIAVAPPTGSAIATTVIRRDLEAETQGARLETAKIVIAGGRGLGSAEGFQVLEKLAAAVGGAVGASRVACDLGWVPHSRQIGLSGKTVSPDLYVAVGISGASQHMAGCGKARAILAINSDPEAAIFKDATFGVVGDYREIVPALIEAIGALP